MVSYCQERLSLNHSGSYVIIYIITVLMCSSSLQSKHTNQTEMLRRRRSKSWEILWFHFFLFEETSLYFKVQWLDLLFVVQKMSMSVHSNTLEKRKEREVEV